MVLQRKIIFTMALRLSCLLLPLLYLVAVSSVSGTKDEGPDFDINDLMSQSQHCPNFRCSSGMTPVPKTRPKFESMGCASMGGGMFVASTGENDAKPYDACCDQWHACYQVCGVSKNTCDTAFETCAKETCGDKEENEQCHKDLQLSTMLLKLGGCQKFDTAQLQACECKSKDQAPAQREAALRHFYKKHAPENVDKVPNLIAKADSPSKLAGLFIKLLLKYPAAIQKKKDHTQDMFDKIRMETNSETTEDSMNKEAPEETPDDKIEL